MNKKITILILAVIASAMGLVLFSHLMQPPEPEPASDSAAVDRSLDNLGSSPAQQTGREPVFTSQGAPQGPLPTIDPPLSRPGAAQPPPAAPAKPTPPPAQPERQVTAPPQRTAPAAPARPDNRQAPEERPAATRASEPRGAEAAKPPVRQQELSLTGKHKAKHVGLHFSGKNILLRIEAGDAFPCKTFLLSGPDRLVVDLPGTWQGLSAPSVPQNTVVKGVRLGNQAAGPRMVLDLTRAVKWQVTRPEATVLEIVVQ